MAVPPRVLGALFVLATCALWIAASFLAQTLVKPEEASQQRKLPPVLLVYICTSLFSLWLPLIAAKHWMQCNMGSTRQQQQQQQQQSTLPLLLLQSEASSTARNILASAWQVLPVASIWFAAQLTFTFSLANTSVTSNTILSSSSSMFTLLAAALVLKERITATKLLSVLSVMAGTAVVTLSDASSDESSRSLLGDVLCVLSAVLYSCYTVMMQRQLKADDSDAPAVFFGYIGSMTLLAGLPVMLVLQWHRVFDLLTVQARVLALAVVNGLMDYVAADYTWARAVLLLGSTGATLGMSVQIPLATLGDLLLHRHPLWMDSSSSILMTCLGTAAIMAGVFGINLNAGSCVRCKEQQESSAVEEDEEAENLVTEPLLQQQLLEPSTPAQVSWDDKSSAAA